MQFQIVAAPKYRPSQRVARVAKELDSDQGCFPNLVIRQIEASVLRRHRNSPRSNDSNTVSWASRSTPSSVTPTGERFSIRSPANDSEPAIAARPRSSARETVKRLKDARAGLYTSRSSELQTPVSACSLPLTCSQAFYPAGGGRGGILVKSRPAPKICKSDYTVPTSMDLLTFVRVVLRTVNRLP